MMYSNMAEESQRVKYALLTSKMLQILCSINRQDVLTPDQKKVLSRGAHLVNKIIEGSELIEGQLSSGIIHSEEGLTTFSYALTSISRLQEENGIKDNFSVYFKQLYSNIEHLQEGYKNHSEIASLKQFFSALRNTFNSALDKGYYPLPNNEQTYSSL